MSFEAALGFASVWRIVSCGGGVGSDDILLEEVGFALEGKLDHGEADFGVVGDSAPGDGVADWC